MSLNPNIKEVQVGIRELKTLKIYPLSVGHQLALSDKLTALVQVLSENQGKNDIELIGAILGYIKVELPELVQYIVDVENVKAFLDDLSVDQAMEIAKIVYEMNYKALAKNVSSLLKKMPQA